MPTMSDDHDEGDEEPQGWGEWFEETIAFWIGVAVIGCSVFIPVGLWIATKFFGWEPPEFIQEWIEFFSA